MPNPSILSLENVMQSDAADIIAARTRAQIIHRTRDIDTAGDEVERTVRSVLQRRLPAAYQVGRGHIVDQTWTASKDYDIVIADRLYQPVLFEAEDQTAYYPFEAVYAVADVRSTYYKSQDPIREFSTKLVDLKARLKRQAVNVVRDTWNLPLNRLIDRTVPLNPLFTFLVFVAANDFDIAEYDPFLKEQSAEFLPNIICFLDKGVVANFRARAESVGHRMLGANLHPCSVSLPVAQRLE